MPISLTILEAIRAELFADDVPIPADATRWTMQQAEDYFSSGGRQVPQPR